MITKFKIFEGKTDDLIDRIKKHLVEDYDHESWEDFVDSQSMGECQSIVSNIVRNFKECKKCFGEIEVDEYYRDEDGEEQNLMTHHWIDINGEYFDFSKGTLKDYIHFYDIYDPYIDDEYRYKLIYCDDN